MTTIVVVAAVIEQDGAFLLTLRPEGTHLSGHWEFPGGKVHPSETHAEALRREIYEELDIVAEVGEIVHRVTHAYPEKVVELHFYRCGFRGEPKAMMGQEIRWVPRGELDALPFPEADAALIRQLAARPVRRLVFETHATSLDNEAGRASGHHDVDLSPAGERQARELGTRYAGDLPALVLTSDLRRAWRTAEIAFGTRVTVIRDARLRECDYGRLTRAPVSEVDAVRLAALVEPFPEGESYTQATARVAACLDELGGRWPAGWVLLVGHRATHYALDHLLGGMPLDQAMRAPFTWQPGWPYELRSGD